MTSAIGFIGLGIMGRGMVPNLAKAGYRVNVWNRTAAKADGLLEGGVVWCNQASEVASSAGVVLLCLSDTAAVEKVVFGSGLVEVLGSGGLIVDLSTILPGGARGMAQRLRELGIGFVDAPVSGGSEGAVAGTLSVMAGGTKADFERARPYLAAVGQTITHVGQVGSGQMVKMVNQILVVGYALAISEALIFAQAGGLDLEKTLKAVSGGAAGSWMLSNRGTQAIRRDWKPGFTIDLQVKDLRLALDEAADLEIPMLITALGESLYRTLQRQGLGAEGNQALVKAMENLSGVKVGT